MERIKERLNSLRAEADAATDRAEAAEAEIKKLQQTLLERDQEIKSFGHRLATLEDDNEKLEASLAAEKAAQVEGVGAKDANETLSRKVTLLEEELDTAEKNLKETVEKLRQVDVKAEHFERQVQRLEQERDEWEKKFEDAEQKRKTSQAELDDLVRTMEGI